MRVRLEMRWRGGGVGFDVCGHMQELADGAALHVLSTCARPKEGRGVSVMCMYDAEMQL